MGHFQLFSDDPPTTVKLLVLSVGKGKGEGNGEERWGRNTRGGKRMAKGVPIVSNKRTYIRKMIQKRIRTGD